MASRQMGSSEIGRRFFFTIVSSTDSEIDINTVRCILKIVPRCMGYSTYRIDKYGIVKLLDLILIKMINSQHCCICLLILTY